MFRPPNRGSSRVLLSQRSSWGHTPQEMLLNDLSPSSPGFAKAIAPGTEGTAKLKTIEGGTQQTQPSPTSPVCHQLQLKHSQVIVQSFTGGVLVKVFKLQSRCSARATKGAARASSSGLQQFQHSHSQGRVRLKYSIFPHIQLLSQNKKHCFGRAAFFPTHPPAPRDTSVGNAAPSALGPRPARAVCPEQGRLQHRSPQGCRLLFLLFLAPSGTKPTKNLSWDPTFSRRLTALRTNPVPPSRAAINQRQPRVIIQQCPSKPELRSSLRSSSSVSALITTQRGVNDPRAEKRIQKPAPFRRDGAAQDEDAVAVLLLRFHTSSSPGVGRKQSEQVKPRRVLRGSRWSHR